MIDLNFQIDIDSIGELVGTISGLEDAWEDEQYLDSLAHNAHNEASRSFDMTMAATARAGQMTHMYEFGVPGITRGTGGPADPTHQSARLYRHFMAGHRGMYDISFTFRPALVPNPMPTTANTGVASKYLRKISRRKYIFRQRAMVTETGMEVEIRPKRGNFLFVPFYGEESHNPRNKRGFMMWNAALHGPIRSTPGSTSAGSFTSFFQTWWMGTGIGIMEKSIQADITRDTMQALELAASRSKTKNFTNTSTAKSIIAGTTARARRRAFTTVRNNAIARRGNNRE